jgi:hypothetical protein
MKDKVLKFEEIDLSHTRWSGGRSCPSLARERDVERV